MSESQLPKSLLEQAAREKDRDTKLAARRAVAAAFARGALIRPDTCEHCGRHDYVEGHHPKGYEPEHWFTLTFLCHLCHLRVHKRIPLMHCDEPFRCERCGHSWPKLRLMAKTCPNCGEADWYYPALKGEPMTKTIYILTRIIDACGETGLSLSNLGVPASHWDRPQKATICGETFFKFEVLLS